MSAAKPDWAVVYAVQYMKNTSPIQGIYQLMSLRENMKRETKKRGKFEIKGRKIKGKFKTKG